MIRFQCPACQKRLKAPDHGAGRKTQCPRCGQRLYVPPPVRAQSQHKANKDQQEPSPSECMDEIPFAKEEPSLVSSSRHRHQGRKEPIGEDAGVRVVQHVYRSLQIDEEWSVWKERGFTWWGGLLAQDVWAEPPFEEAGFEVSRVHIRTDLLRNFQGMDSQVAKLGAVMRYATMSGPIRDPSDSSRVQMASSLYIHNGTVDGLKHIASFVAALQVSEAHVWADGLPDLLGAKAARSKHPQSGIRKVPDDMLNVIESLIRPYSGDGSAYHGAEILDLRELLENPPCVLANGDEKGYVAEFPFGDFTSLLRLSTTEPHPRLGNGVLILLKIPIPGQLEDDPATTALALNEMELQSRTRCHFLGSWCPDEDGVMTFCSFFPNLLAGRGWLRAFTQSSITRARWVTENVFKQPWDYEMAVQAIHQRMELLERMLTQDESIPTKLEKLRVVMWHNGLNQ